MISSTHRFHGHNSLNYVYRHGNTVRGPLCALKFARNERRQTYRVAIVVSKKVSKSAVIRNRIRRRLYEAFRLESTQFNGPFDLVVTVFHEQVADMPSSELTQMVHAQLKQAAILTGS